MNKRVLAIVIIVAVVMAGAALIIHKKRVLAHLASPGNPPVPVATATVRAGSVSNTVETVALVAAETAATVAAQVSGVLLEVRFREGDPVRKGELMVRIDPSMLDDAVQAAQARLTAAQEDLAKQQAIFGRDQILYDNQAIARQAFEISAAQLEGVKAAQVSAARALASATTMRAYAGAPAPFAGVVSARLVEPGDLAAPGKPLYTIQVPGGVKIISKFSQETLARLKAGDEVTFAAAGRTLTAPTTRLYPALDAAHLGTVETRLSQPPFGLQPGATVTARYATAPTAGLVVPTSALLQGLRETLLIRVRDGRADPVPVTVTGESGSEAAVSGPVRPGDVVVTGLPSALMALTAGTPVAVQPPTGAAESGR
ncbi:MAG: efflux RND transporter periplasmic adaptor subunit [Candidatus Krumholzibacteriia bacterium]